MTSVPSKSVHQTNRTPIRWVDPELADPRGSTAAVGGLHQTKPMAFLHLPNMNLVQAVDFEIRAARQLGVDGFQFYYPLVDSTVTLAPRYNQIIRTFIQLSETSYPGFRVSLCLSHPNSQKAISEAERPLEPVDSESCPGHSGFSCLAADRFRFVVILSLGGRCPSRWCGEPSPISRASS